MKNKILVTSLVLILLVSLNFASALIVDADYITIYPGEQGTVELEIENNENFDIEDVSARIVLYETTTLPDGTPITMSLPFTVIGSSEKDVDDIDDDDDESVKFTLKASTDIAPGDYNIPYIIKYFNAEDESEENELIEKAGSFAIRVSAKTELDFGVEVRENAIVGEEGKVSLEIINKGLGDIKSVSVEIIPEGFELLSKSKIFIGTVNSDDTDLASFDVLYKTTNPVLKAKVTYKDFDNKEHFEIVNLVFKVYTEEEALEKGLITKSNTSYYIIVIILIILIWFIYRKIKKSRKKKAGRN